MNVATLNTMKIIELKCTCCGKTLNCYAPIDYPLIFCEKCKVRL